MAVILSAVPRIGMIMALTTWLLLSVVVQCSSLRSSGMDEAMLMNQLDDLQDVVEHAILSDMEAEDSAAASAEDAFYPNALNDIPLLKTLVRSAVAKEMAEITGRRPYRFREGGELSKRSGSKRSFDSISQNSGFGGMHRSSFGGEDGNGENLTFTFESLFPAIARGLRSTK